MVKYCHIWSIVICCRGCILIKLQSEPSMIVSYSEDNGSNTPLDKLSTHVTLSEASPDAERSREDNWHETFNPRLELPQADSTSVSVESEPERAQAKPAQRRGAGSVLDGCPTEKQRKQIKYQTNHRLAGLCISCPHPVIKGSYCESCRSIRNASQKIRRARKVIHDRLPK